MCKIAELMNSQNEAMLAGLRSAASGRPPAASRVDFVAQNIKDVGPGRSTMSRQEQAKLAHAQVLASATAHLPSVAARSAPKRAGAPATASAAAGATATEDALIKAAREEIERGAQISSFERETRGPRLAHVGVRRAF